MSAQDTTAANDAAMITAAQPDQHGLKSLSARTSRAISQEHGVVGGKRDGVVEIGADVTAPFAGGDQ